MVNAKARFDHRLFDPKPWWRWWSMLEICGWKAEE